MELIYKGMPRWQNYLEVLLIFVLSFSSCSEKEVLRPIQTSTAPAPTTYKLSTNFPEGFNSPSKTAYATASVSFATGSWTLNDALTGNTTSDKKYGAQSIRIRSLGKLTMNFDVNSPKDITILHSRYGTDASCSWELWMSSNAGGTWSKVGNSVACTFTSLTAATFTVNATGATRFEIRKVSGGSTVRMNIDDITINEPDLPTRDNNIAMGNPSAAVKSTTVPNNYLMEKGQYAMSYNNAKGTANWVSWHLSTAWKGSTPRQNSFAQDMTLPSTFYHVTSTSYTNSGFDRGHLCPSEDRDGSVLDNDTTFLMTNMLPQAPNANQITWLGFEDYCRTLMYAGYELYIIAGGYGQGGTGSLGGVTNTINGGNINVPARLWKVAIILPTGSNDVSRVSNTTRVIAVDMPNTQTVNAQSWGAYRVSVDALETSTGYDFLSNVPTAIQAVIESAVDTGPTI